MKPFDFQEECIQACLKHIKSKNKKPGVVVAPTAWGKSILLSEVAFRVEPKVLILQPSVELLKQNFEKFKNLGGDAKIYSASMGCKEIGHVTFATLGSIKALGKDFRELGVSILLIDECDSSYDPKKGSVFAGFIKDLAPKSVIGVTATPVRMETKFGGSYLKVITATRPSFFKHFIYVMQIKDIIAKDRWTPIQYETYEFDESALILNSSGTEYTDESIQQFNLVQGINNKIYLRIKDMIANGYNSILVFCDSIESANRFCEFTPNSGVIHGMLSKKERTAVLEDFQSGKIKVLYNFLVLSVGYDHPSLQALIMGRPTGSFRLYYQILGRGVRKHPTKKEFRYIDYGGNTKRFGRIEDVTFEEHATNGWSLFSNERLLSGVSLNGPIITKKMLDKKPLGAFKKSKSTYKIPIGKHKGLTLSEVPISYLDFMVNKFQFTYETQEITRFKREAREYLEINILASIN